MKATARRAAVALAAMLATACGSGGSGGGSKVVGGGVQAGPPAVGTVTNTDELATVNGHRAGGGDSIPRSATLGTDGRGFLGFNFIGRVANCKVRANSELQVQPDDTVLAQWAKGDAACWLDGTKVQLGAGNTRFTVDRAVLSLAVSGQTAIVRSHYGFLDVLPDPSATRGQIVGPDTALTVRPGTPPAKAHAEVNELPPAHQQDVVDLKTLVPKLGFGLPAPADRGPGTRRLAERGTLRVGIDPSASAAARAFTERFVQFVAEGWGVRLEVSPVSPPAAAARLAARTLDLTVAADGVTGHRADPLFDDATGRVWNVYGREDNEGVSDALAAVLRPALDTGEYGRRYEAAFGRPAGYEPLRNVIFSQVVTPPPTTPSTAAPGPSTSRPSTTLAGVTTTGPATTAPPPSTSTTVAALVTGNLVVNPGAEQSPASASFTVGVAPAGWQRGSLFGIALAYGSSAGTVPPGCVGGGPGPSAAQMGGTGLNYFNGGYDSNGGCGLTSSDTPTLVQVVPLASYGGRLAGVGWEASAKLNSYPGSGDGAQLIVELLNLANNVLSRTATDVVSNPANDFLFRSRTLTGRVPAGAVAARITLSFPLVVAYSGSAADDVSFRLTG